MNSKQRALYQGSKHDDYFEGWYFKHVVDGHSISIIPGISQATNDKHAFIQIINTFNNETYYIRFKFEEFSFNHDPFYVKIADNYFSFEEVILDIKEPIIIKGNFKYQNLTPLKNTILQPNIMGIFGYLPFMECNHCIISLKHDVSTNLIINEQIINTDNGIGYIEKDYGISFPKDYIWLQSNNSNKGSNIFFSYANIPFKFLTFEGLICVVNYNDIQYRFATYNLSKIKDLVITKDYITLTLTKKSYKLNIKIKLNDAHPLIAPIKGAMVNTVYESLNSNIEIELYHKDNLIVEDQLSNTGLELYGKYYDAFNKAI